MEELSLSDQSKIKDSLKFLQMQRKVKKKITINVFYPQVGNNISYYQGETNNLDKLIVLANDSL